MGLFQLSGISIIENLLYIVQSSFATCDNGPSSVLNCLNLYRTGSKVHLLSFPARNRPIHTYTERQSMYCCMVGIVAAGYTTRVRNRRNATTRCRWSGHSLFLEFCSCMNITVKFHRFALFKVLYSNWLILVSCSRGMLAGYPSKDGHRTSDITPR